MKKEMIKDTRKHSNIINWYPFKENSDILQIGLSSKEISEFLVSKSKQYSLALTNSELEEVKQYKNNIVNLEDTEKKYDYVCLIGSLTVYKNDEKAYKKLIELIKIAKQKCKIDGTILLVIDNKYGMKFWTSIYANKNILCNDKYALSKTMIEQVLDLEGLKNRKFYYALPDYNLTNVIFTDSYLPTLENISRNFTCLEDEFISFNQTETYQEILKEDKNLFPFFANTYIVEINAKLDNKIRFVSYTNIRKEEYSIKTIIYDNRVEKTYANENSKKHIELIKTNIEIMNKAGIKTLDSYKEDKIESKFVNEKSYDQILIQYLKQGKNEEFFEKIQSYKQYLYERLEPVNPTKTIFDKYNIKIEKEKKEKMQFVKNGLWDLIFQNAFYIENQLYFYDQEWYEENIPIEFIIYRAITYFGESHRYISKEEILKKLDILDLKEIFEELDNLLQLEIRDDKMWSLHCNVKTGQTLYDLYQNLINEFEEYKKNYNEEKNKEIVEKMNKLEQYNKNLLKSTSWKITKPIRNLGKYFKR